ncbi:hypothetical protein [Gilliamella apicola]|uniref:hypothetical protein n=1 Tax=Gilliamella apicola TaxID=1196095 RepID=UPI0009FDE4EC|nr:hypothetical protein [Gilliamella apicola]ORF44546.1 hypothetical protein B5800_11250 [Gilliamella apicola]ORF47799.1 hypothetical protein B5803_11790 [Gilliamella apicola]ORF48403.1 hypothetical protein B5799_08680 [Gilliamella apicola]ORF52777.1 hypothetical protein B5798_10945 [Gilliamella apicola]ORF56608.1 hypothetical protein B5802_05210 [Gilliamella apicola]
MAYLQICKKLHRYGILFKSLPEYQGTFSRHKCAGCAYELGYFHAINGKPKATNDSVLSKIPYSQAGHVRHKDAFTAYKEGYEFALSIANAS